MGVEIIKGLTGYYLLTLTIQVGEYTIIKSVPFKSENDNVKTFGVRSKEMDEVAKNYFGGKSKLKDACYYFFNGEVSVTVSSSKEIRPYEWSVLNKLL